MSDSKSQITEREAVIIFNQRMIDCAILAWPKVRENIRQLASNEEDFSVSDEEQATFDLMLASSALDLQAMKNIFPKEQAEKLETLIYEAGQSKKYGNYAEREIKRYSTEFQKEMAGLEGGGNPMAIVPALLLHRWIGSGLWKLSIEVSGEPVISPVMIDAVLDVLCSPHSGLGTWKRIYETFDLIEVKV